MKGKLASLRNREIRGIQERRLDEQFRARLSGDRSSGTFDLEDVERLHLEVLTDPMLRDVKKVVLWTDQKRRAEEDLRAFRRNRNGWMGIAISVCIGVMLPYFIPIIAVWLLNMITLLPQFALLAVKTVRKY